MGDGYIVRRGGGSSKPPEGPYAWKKSTISSISSNYSITVTLTYKDTVVATITGKNIEKFEESDFIGATLKSDSFVIYLEKDKTVKVTYNKESMKMGTWSYTKGVLSFSKEMNQVGMMFGKETPTGTVTKTEKIDLAGSFVSFVISDNASAYPSDGKQGSYYYKSILR